MKMSKMLNKSYRVTTAKKEILGLLDIHDLSGSENGILCNPATNQASAQETLLG